MVTYTSLKEVIPSSVFSELPEVITRYAINSPLRLAHFISQCAHESANFSVAEENLNYSAKALVKVFNKYFPDEGLAKFYERKPIAIASRVYGNRMGNGSESSLDGWVYRGRGYIQLTGLDNYKSFNKILNDDIVKDPSLVSSKYPLLSAAWFWNERKLNEIADRGDTVEVIKAVTKKINGGYNGLDDRIKLFNKIYPLLK